MNGGYSRDECIRSGCLRPLWGRQTVHTEPTWAWRDTGGGRGRWVESTGSRTDPVTGVVSVSDPADGSWFEPTEHPLGYGDPDHEAKMARIREAQERNERKGIV